MSQDLTQDAFITLYSRHQTDIHRYIRSLMPNRADADDVVQETARLLWSKFDQYDSTCPFLPWARQFAYLEVLKQYKRQSARNRRFSQATLDAIASSAAADDDVAEAQREALELCMRKLTPPQRELIRQRYISETPITQLASEQNRPINTLYSDLHRVRRALLDCIERRLAAWGVR